MVVVHGRGSDRAQADPPPYFRPAVFQISEQPVLGDRPRWRHVGRAGGRWSWRPDREKPEGRKISRLVTLDLEDFRPVYYYSEGALPTAEDALVQEHWGDKRFPFIERPLFRGR